ncbi:MAG: ATP synthase F1 subunit delta [Oligoflexia bacterium]|nr:ATP synthase F1 subunit delta [Oligoflexia bacterium]
MSESKIAAKYAGALFDAAVEKGDKHLEPVLNEFQKLCDILSRDNGDSFRRLNSPLISLESKLDVLEKVLKGKIQELVYDTLVLLLKRGRFQHFFEIVEIFSRLVDSHNGVIRGDVHIAAVPDKQRADKITETLSSLTGKKVIANMVEDPSLVAGFVTYLGTYYIDYSLSSHLKKIENELKRS